MARPVTRRTSVRVQTMPVHEAPSLPVAAPGFVRTAPPEQGGFQALLQALGVGAGIVGKNMQAREEFDKAQGAADEKLGQADMARAKKSRAYADGAFQVATLEQYQEAERKVAQRADAELDKSLPADDQIRIVDGWMKSELGPMVTDPRAKLLIADQYQKFIDTFAGSVLKGQAEANAKAALETVTQTATADLERSGTFDWDRYFHLIYSQTGDATVANAALVGVVTQQMEDAAARGEDYEQFRELIPKEVTGPNGEKLPGPMYSPKYRGIVQESLQRSEALRNKALAQQYAASEYQARSVLDEMLTAGQEITDDTFAAKGITIGNGPQYDLSPAVAAQYKQSSQAVKFKANEEQAEYDGALEARRTYGRFGSIQGLPGAPDTADGVQKAFDRFVQEGLVGMGYDLSQLGGGALTSNVQAVGDIANFSAQEGVPYGPLKRDLSSINQAAPGDVMARLNAYKILKAKGADGLYVDDDAALIYEVAIGAEEAGEKKEGIAERIRTMGDKPTHDYVASQMPKLKVRKNGFDIKTGGGLLGMETIRSSRAGNAGYLATKYERLAASALSRQMSLEDAQRYAEERINATHASVNVAGTWYVLPKTSVGDPKVATEAIDWYVQDQIPKVKKAAKIPEDEPVTALPIFDLRGRALSFEVVRDGNVRVEGSKPFSLQGLVSVYRRVHPAPDYKAQAIKRSEQIRQQNLAPASDPNANINPATRPGRE